MPTTPKRKSKNSSDNGLGGGLAGFEETPYSIKKRAAAGESTSAIPTTSIPVNENESTRISHNTDQYVPALTSPTKRLGPLASAVKSPSKLRMMSKSFTPENNGDPQQELLDYSPTPSPAKKVPRTPSKPRNMRSMDELDQSARKRAYNVILRSRLDVENGVEEVDETELRLAEQIIEESYNDDADSDYIPEKQPASTPRRGRTATKRYHEEEEDDDEDEEMSDTPDSPSTRRRKGKSTPTKSKTVRRRAPASPASAPAEDEDSDENFHKGGATDDMVALFLDGYEGYFDQHKTREKISTAPFSRAPNVEFQEFINYVDLSRTFYRDSRDFLLSLYRTMFTQWYFELMQGYSLLFYGVGSKRNLLLEFVTSTIPEEVPVLVVNGYNPATSFKELLNSLIPSLIDDASLKMPKNTPDLLQTTLSYLDSNRLKHALSEETNNALRLPKAVLLIHNIDGESLRSDKTQSFLSQLAAIPEIWLVATIDHINAPVMWDAAKLALYNFLWHDLTTYESYAIETSFEDPLSLGKVRTAAGNKGVKYVLSSLTMKARGLYRVLICYQIEAMSSELPSGTTQDDIRNIAGSVQFGIEFKLLYQKCVEEFLVSNELNFRTMLTEFLDHKMAIITKDSAGTEIVYVPYTKETIENILEEDLMD